MAEGPIVLELDGPLARITLNRPAVLNAMNLAWVEGLERAVQRAMAAPRIRVLVIRGAGRAFCSGLDLDMFAEQGMPPGFYAVQERAFRALEMTDATTIAALHGYCLGGGVQLAIACDIRVCSDDARLGLPAINEGLIPGLAPYRLPRLIGLGPARRLILSGEIIGAEEALRIGLVDHLVPAEHFEEGLAEIVDRYLRAPRTASIGAKRLARLAFDSPYEAALELSEAALGQCLVSPEAAAARQAWRERKRSRGAEPPLRS